MSDITIAEFEDIDPEHCDCFAKGLDPRTCDCACHVPTRDNTLSDDDLKRDELKARVAELEELVQENTPIRELDFERDLANRLSQQLEATESIAMAAAFDAERARMQREEDFERLVFTNDSGLECTVCERLTNNGTCTQCRHGTSPLMVARSEASQLKAEVDRLNAALKTQASALLTGEVERLTVERDAARAEADSKADRRLEISVARKLKRQQIEARMKALEHDKAEAPQPTLFDGGDK